MTLHGARSRAHAGVWLAVFTLHLVVLWLLASALTTRSTRSTRATSAPPVARVALRLIAVPPRAAPPPGVVEPPSAHRTANPVRAVQAPRGEPTAARPPAANAPAERATEVADAPEPAASAEPSPSLLDTPATRRAIRDSARAPSLGDRLARSRDEPDRVGPAERLANGVKSAGKGDCLKGDFAGSGMGLLSLPFLVVAEARGDCAK